VLPKPATADDVDRLHELARRLDGRPVPGVRMSEREFEDWCDEDVKAEWVDGAVILMTPENIVHLTLVQWLTFLFQEFVADHDLGRVIGREFSVRLPRQRRRRCPDVQFIATSRLHLIGQTFVDGAPDLIVEVVSPSSVSRDWRNKFSEYERAGVREYWIFDPASQHVEAYAIGKGKRYQLIREAEGWIESAVLPGFAFKVGWLKLVSLPRVARALKEMSARRPGRGGSRAAKNGAK
jgi:Uma2 family endonuclease